MHQKYNNQLEDFLNYQTRNREWIAYELRLNQFALPFYFKGPEIIDIPAIENYAYHVYHTLPVQMNMTRKFLKTRDAVQAYVEDHY